MQKRSIHLIPIIELETDTQLALREIRNDPEVRRFMYTDHVIGVNEHLRWITQLKMDNSQVVFGMIENNSPIGAVSLQGRDANNKRSDCSLYLSPERRGDSVGMAVERQFFDLAFGTLGLEKLNAVVTEGNDVSLRFHKRLGFEEEGFRKSEIVRDGKRIGVHLLGLNKGAWAEREAILNAEHGKVFERFAIEIHWSPGNKALTAIDKIEEARAKNNVNWMNILRIAVEKSPLRAKQIIADIREIDQQISALTAELNLEP